MTNKVTLEEIRAQKHQLSTWFLVDGHRFATTYWFDTVDFGVLQTRFGLPFMEEVYFHIAAFEINKICSLRPAEIDWGPYSHFVDEEFRLLWSTIFRHVWAQWRYENDDPEYLGPTFSTPIASIRGTPIKRDLRDSKTLAFFGGGKDSLVGAKLLESIGQPYASLVYASSIYGGLTQQHEQISRLLQCCNPTQVHRQWILDDFLESPVLALGPATTAKTLTAAETPSSIFASLPIVLANEITEICLAHEKSSDTGQVIWNRTGEDVNHQWGKSLDAERLINTYIQGNLLRDFHYFSILKPIHDVMIFNLLREHEPLTVHTHSCNVSKPWCRRCPKCLYVWVNYMAYLDTSLVESIFQENLGDVPENLSIFRELLGFEEQLPFECIGQLDETRLAFELCIAKGVVGRAFDMYKKERKPLDLESLLDKYLGIYGSESEIPQRIQTALNAKLDRASKTARSYIQRTLRGEE